MSVAYKNPGLCNYYCSNGCPIGQKYVPEIKVKDLSQIVLEMVASLNSMQRKQERFIEIVADGKIEEDEIKDFVNIQEQLEKISLTVKIGEEYFFASLQHSKRTVSSGSLLSISFNQVIYLCQAWI